MMTIASIIQWILLGEKIFAAGAKVWLDVKAVLASNGVEADTAALDAIIADADRRRGIAQQEAGGVGGPAPGETTVIGE